MHWKFNQIITFFQGENRDVLLKGGLHGLEKESLRVQQNGHLATSPHPNELSDPLSDPHVTTDFSESQIEMITSPFPTPDEALQSLDELHRRVVSHLTEGELLWPMSMPCRLPAEHEIPIAQYGDSEEAQRRELYRKGLAARYGKVMQMVCGVHYNFSFSESFWGKLHETFGNGMSRQDFVNESYLAIARNFLRYRWLTVYLFGASPLADETYRCEAMGDHHKDAVSLRLSRCGYSNPTKIPVSYNDFNQHLSDIRRAVSTPHPPYEEIEEQLNSNLLQIPNELYGSIRLKPGNPQGDMLEDLAVQGAGYLEMRLFDLNPLSPIGVVPKQLYFAHLLLVFCLLKPSPPISDEELQAMTKLQQEVALEGQTLAEEQCCEACEILEEMRPVAELLDRAYGDTRYGSVLDSYTHDCEDRSHLPWSRILTEMRMNNESFLEFGMRKAREHDGVLRG